MKIFVISLKDSPRREAMQNQMDKSGIDFEFFDAVDGRNGVPKEYEHLVDYKAIRKNIRRDMTSGEIGCALSHKFLYDKIVEDEIEHTIILEDDVILDEDFKMVLEVKALEKDEVSLMFFYALDAGVKKSSKQPFFKNYVSYKSFMFPYGAVAYYIDLEMGLKLQNSVKIIKTVADNWRILLNLNDFKIIYPRLVCHPIPRISQLEKDRLQKKNTIRIYIVGKIIEKAITTTFNSNISHDLRQSCYGRFVYLNVFEIMIWAFKIIRHRKDIMYIYQNIEGKS